MGSILIAFAAIVYYQEVTKELTLLDRSLYRKTRVMTENVQYRFDKGEWRVNLEDVPLLGNNTQEMDTELVYARWYDAQGQLKQFFGLPPVERLTAVNGFKTIKPNNNKIGEITPNYWLRQVTLPVVYKRRLLIGYIQVAAPLAPVQDTLNQLRLFLTLAVPTALGVIGMTGWFLGGLAMQPIRQSYEQLQRFTADASHELRAPLAAILSNAQVGLLSPVDDFSQPRLRLEKIVDVAKSMSSLVDNLLFLARHEGRLAAESLKEIDLSSWLQEIANNYTPQTIAQNLSFTTDLTKQPVNLRVDPELLQQAVMNLLSNACKYTPVGGKVQLRLFTRSRQAVIQVEDSGVGIPAANLPHIFERFYRVDTERSRSSGGFGLGLAIAQQIVQAHNGQISARSVVGQGSVFEIQLPLK